MKPFISSSLTCYWNCWYVSLVLNAEELVTGHYTAWWQPCAVKTSVYHCIHYLDYLSPTLTWLRLIKTMVIGSFRMIWCIILCVASNWYSVISHSRTKHYLSLPNTWILYLCSQTLMHSWIHLSELSHIRTHKVRMYWQDCWIALSLNSLQLQPLEMCTHNLVPGLKQSELYH